MTLRDTLGMGCKHTASPRLSEFLDGRLSASERAWMQEHVLGCSSCREELRMLHLLSQRAGNVGTRARSERPTHDPDSRSWSEVGLADRVLREVARRKGDCVAQLEAPSAPRSRWYRPGRPARIAVAAAALLVCSLASGLFGYQLGQRTPNAPGAAPSKDPVYFVNDPGHRMPATRTAPEHGVPLRRIPNRREWPGTEDQPIRVQPARYR